MSRKIEAQMPLPGKAITSPFGWRMHPIFHRRIFHDGVDIAACSGDKIQCIMDGRVQQAGRIAGYGNAVVIYHPKTNKKSMYAHLSRIFVKSGQSVECGMAIGMAGSTGLSTGVHLHFGVKSDSGWIDPISYVIGCREENAFVALSRSLPGTKCSGVHAGI